MIRKLALVSMMVFSACSSVPKSFTEIPVEHTDTPYAVRERYPDPGPEWAKNFYKFKKENEGKGPHYYLGESGDVSDRIMGCDIAELYAKKKIAQQVASLVSGKMALLKDGQLFVNKDDTSDNHLRQYAELKLAEKALAILSGVKQSGVYWEERDYSKSNGRKSVYTCMVLSEISEQDLDVALRQTTRKAPDAISDPQAKAEVKEHIKELDDSFNTYFNKNQ